MGRIFGIILYFSIIVLEAGCAVSTENIATHVFDNKITLYQETTPSIEIMGIYRWMSQLGGEESNQGADAYGDLLCQFRADHSSLDIMDMRQKNHVATIPLQSLGSAYHCNNADFSNFFYKDSDEFPLLYSSHQGKDARCILVDRIYKVKEEYQLKTVQIIRIPYNLDEPLQYTPDAIIDEDNSFLYVYTGNTEPTTSLYIYKFRMPKFVEGITTLSENDIEAVWIISDNPPKYKQGGTIKDGIIYLMEGVPRWGADNILRVIDLQRGLYSIINLSKDFNVKWEPEDIFWYDDCLYAASNRSGIYQIKVK